MIKKFIIGIALTGFLSLIMACGQTETTQDRVFALEQRLATIEAVPKTVPMSTSSLTPTPLPSPMLLPTSPPTSVPAPTKITRGAASFADCLINTVVGRYNQTGGIVIQYRLDNMKFPSSISLDDVTGDHIWDYAARSCRDRAPIAPPLWHKEGCIAKAVEYFNRRHPFYLPDGINSYNKPNPERRIRGNLEGLFALEVCRPISDTEK